MYQQRTLFSDAPRVSNFDTLSFILISPHDDEFIQAMHRHYSAPKTAPPGSIVWEIRENDVVRGWIGLGEPYFKLSPRRLLGLEDARPLPDTVNNFIFRLELEGDLKGSDILKAWHSVADKEYTQRNDKKNCSLGNVDRSI